MTEEKRPEATDKITRPRRRRTSSPKEGETKSEVLKKSDSKKEKPTAKKKSSDGSAGKKPRAKKKVPEQVTFSDNLLDESVVAATSAFLHPKAKPNKVKVEEKELPRSIERIRSTFETEKSKEDELKIVTERKKREGLSLMMILLVITFIIILLCSLIFIRLNSDSRRTAYIAAIEGDGDIIFEIKEGMSAREVAKNLSRIVDSDALLGYLKEQKLESSLMIGTYRVPVGISIENLALLITNKGGDSVIIFDGYTLVEIDSMLTNRGLISGGDFMKAVHRVKAERGLPFEEGYFLSGKYKWSDAYSLASSMQDEMMKVLLDNGDAILREDLSLDEVVILSSMVNRETQSYKQMSVIAAIMLNRYRKGMPLGIDATSRYELDLWTGKLSKEVFEKDTPYNTRRKPGLPPTGIGCPGVNAVLSVLNPDVTDALYYLHDEGGTLYTSNSYDEHLMIYDKIHK